MQLNFANLLMETEHNILYKGHMTDVVDSQNWDLFSVKLKIPRGFFSCYSKIQHSEITYEAGYYLSKLFNSTTLELFC